MTDIRVDTDKLRSAAAEIEIVGDEVDAAASDANAAAINTHIDPQYADQLAGKLRGVGAELIAQVSPITNGLREHVAWLRDLALRFDEADHAAAAGMDQLWAASRALLIEFGESPFVPRWLLDGSCPPWVDRRMWWQLSEEDRDLMIRDLRRTYANFMAGRTVASFRPSASGSAHLEEMFMIYLFGLPTGIFQEREVTNRMGRRVTVIDQTEAYLPEHDLFRKPALPNGNDVNDRWRWQYQDLPDMMSAAQRRGYIPASIDPTSWRGWEDAHYNLCGENSVGHAVGVSHMAYSYLALAELWEPPLLKNEGLSPYHVAMLYEQFGWEAHIVGPFAGSELHWDEWTGEHPRVHVVPGMEVVNGYLRQGYAVTALVGVNSGPSAALSSTEAAVGHYANILETFTTRDGVEVVRVFNPLEHREEIYTWEHLQATWGKWENVDGNSAGQAIIARPGEDG